MKILEKHRKFKIGIAIGVTAIMLAALITAGVFAQQLLGQQSIYPFVTVEGITVHDMTPEEAKSHLQTHLKPQQDEQYLVFSFKGQEWTIPFAELGFEYNYEEALQQAMNYGRTGSRIERLSEIRRLRQNPADVELTYGYRQELLTAFLNNLATELHIEAKAASITRTNQEFIVTPDQTGQTLDIEKTFQLAHEALTGSGNNVITLVMDEIMPYPTAADLRQIQTTISEFSTTFSSADSGRTANLKIGSSSINGQLLLPGETFSFNETTGPRIAAAGYKEAPVIVMGELVPGVGGGICQVSTTLYNAVLRADLKIEERMNHSIPVSYVPRGQDATVSFGAIDFRFTNNREYPIFIESDVVGTRLSVRIYGNVENSYTIDLISRDTEVIASTTETRYNDTLYEDEIIVERAARNGYRVVTYKVYREGGQEVSREEISRDHYRVTHGIVVHGTKPRPTETPEWPVDWPFVWPIQDTDEQTPQTEIIDETPTNQPATGQ